MTLTESISNAILEAAIEYTNECSGEFNPDIRDAFIHGAEFVLKTKGDGARIIIANGKQYHLIEVDPRLAADCSECPFDNTCSSNGAICNIFGNPENTIYKEI